ncbi:MAG: tRNA pseudouridine(54/55) synthase Pus10, partial [Methanomicrobiales archaeon]|nr:tRNA pseudouridine(54/55) synthase Pus10 [Methanomicrobiales archaeon]
MEIIEEVEAILGYGDTCNHCLGRFFGKRSFGLTNDERGRSLRIAHEIATNRPHEEPAPES